MTPDQLITAVVTIVGVGLSVAYYPQAWRIWKKRSSEDVSIPSYILFAVGVHVGARDDGHHDEPRHDKLDVGEPVYGRELRADKGAEDDKIQRGGDHRPQHGLRPNAEDTHQ